MIDSGIRENRISQSTNKAWLQFDASIREMEQLFQTKYYYYEHVDGGPKHIGCEDYKVPTTLSEHMDYITPGVKPLTTKAMGDVMRRNLASKQSSRPVRKAIPDHSLAARQNPGMIFQYRGSVAVLANSEIGTANLSECASSRTSLTPECVRTLYNIPLGTLSNPTNSLGIFSQISTYSQEDLDMFYETYAP
jgi:tripeptidyl-peptidase-1